MAETRSDKYENLRQSLKSDRTSWDAHWRDLSDYILPRRAQFYLTDNNSGEKKNTKIINSRGSQDARTLRAGMMGGITSPARPWFRLTTTDPKLSEVGRVKTWLHEVTRHMGTAFLQSNLYNALPIVYGDLGTFGTAAMMIEEDFDKVIRCYVFPIGSYAIANDGKGQVRVFSREFRMKVRQVIEKFATDENGNVDWSKLSTHIKNLYDSKSLDTWIDIHHIIHANSDYDPRSALSNKKKYRSVYYEFSSSSRANTVAPINENKFLRDSGYDYFPVLVPRWEVSGEDEYGASCPGMIALGDIKALQLMEKRKAQALEKKVRPPMTAPTSLKTQKASILAGDITYVDERAGGQAFKPAHDVNFQISELDNDIERHERRISQAWYADLFLMLANTTRRQITAREVDERHEEKLLALGPVLEQLNQDLLDPLIDITFDIMLNQGLLPEPPEELQGSALKVEYVSIMHQAQKAAGLAGIDRFIGFMGDVAGLIPSVLDKINSDQLADEYGEITGVPPTLIWSDEDVVAIRESKQQLAAQQQKMDMLQQGASVAKDLSGANVGGKNALEALVEQSEAGGLA